jgi:hypothetical protein
MRLSEAECQGVAALPVVLACAFPLEGGEIAPRAGYIHGSEKAPITIEVFSSLTCPSCARLHLETCPGSR